MNLRHSHPNNVAGAPGYGASCQEWTSLKIAEASKALRMAISRGVYGFPCSSHQVIASTNAVHSFARHRRRPGKAAPKTTSGLMLTGGWRCDLHEWFFDRCMFRGKGRELRRRTVALACLQPGEQVRDVGCGTGTLALDAWRRVGIDPGREQIARACAKAARRRAPIEFQIGVIEQLDFPEQTFDMVFSTLMMHHLPAKLKRLGLAALVRVLKTGRRLVIADFTRKQERSGRAARFHAGGSSLEELAALVADAGFVRVETEQMQPPRLSACPVAGVVWAYKGGGGAEPSQVAHTTERLLADSGVPKDQMRAQALLDITADHHEATASGPKRSFAPLAIALAQSITALDSLASRRSRRAAW